MITRRTFGAMLGAAAVAPSLARAGTLPAPFDKRGKAKIALVRYLSTGDFFEAYLSGVQMQAKALGVDLHVFDSQQQAAVQADMVDQAIALGVDGIIIQHGLTSSLQAPAQRAVAAGIKTVAFDVELHNPKIPQVSQDNGLIAKLSIGEMLKQRGTAFKAGYVYVPGIAPLDQRNAVWVETLKQNPGIKQVAECGTLSNPIPNSVANQARAVLMAHPDITVMFAPYDAFAKGVKIAVDELNMSDKVAIYSADVSTADILSMRADGSAWKATAATNPTVVGEVCLRAVSMMMAGEDPGHQVVVPPRLITQKMLRDLDIKNMTELAAKMPSFTSVDVAMPKWMPAPKA